MGTYGNVEYRDTYAYDSDRVVGVQDQVCRFAGDVAQSCEYSGISYDPFA